MKKVFVSFVALLLSLGATAQTIRGEVVDALTGEPLTGAHVMIVGMDDFHVVADMD